MSVVICTLLAFRAPIVNAFALVSLTIPSLMWVYGAVKRQADIRKDFHIKIWSLIYFFIRDRLIHWLLFSFPQRKDAACSSVGIFHSCDYHIGGYLLDSRSVLLWYDPWTEISIPACLLACVDLLLFVLGNRFSCVLCRQRGIHKFCAWSLLLAGQRNWARYSICIDQMLAKWKKARYVIIAFENTQRTFQIERFFINHCS